MSDVREMIAEQMVQRGLGGLAPHLASLPHLPPDIASVDLVDMTASITTTPVVTDPQAKTLSNNYLSELMGIAGYMSNPGTDPELLPLVTFRLEEFGRAGKLFTSDIRMSYLASTAGTKEPIYFPRSLYVFRRGAQVQVTFQTLAGYAAAASETKTFGVLLICGLFAGR